MHFVDDVDFIAVAGGHVLDIFPQQPDIVNAVIGRAIDLMHVDAVAARDFKAGGADAAGHSRGAAVAVEALGKNARDGGLAHAPLPGKKEGMSDALLLDGVSERAGHMLLADNLVKGLRPALAG